MKATGSPPSRLWRRIAGVQGLVLVGLIVWDGADRVPADASRPLVVVPASAPFQPLGETLRLASFNIHSGKGHDGQVDLQRTEQRLAESDVAGLYEVRNSPWNGDVHQGIDLGRRLGMASVFAATERHWWREHFGNALLSRVPLDAVQRLPLPGTRGKAYRAAVLAHIPWQGKTLHLIAVHVDRGGDRESQLKLLIPLFRALETPAILMGDLNTPASDPHLAALLQDPEVRSPLHEKLTSTLPAANIDWIFTRGLETVSAELVENDASDHPVARAVLRLPGSTP
ncbi:MAG: hypothetical protein SFV23_02210 [Planctomycetaceae bacterium]|nr:hypothetical protein [Planctomycetaceae bacterium]